MKTTPVLILGSLAALAVIVALIVSRGDRVKSPDAALPAAAPFFEGLAPRLKDVAAITVKHGDKEFNIRRTAQGWEIPERGGFPAKGEEVRKVLFQIGELRQAEPKTSKPELYSQLGVQDPDGAPLKEGESGPTLVTFKDDQGQTLASAIVGNTKFGSPQGVFIRKAGQAQSWLAEGALDIPGDAVRWMDSSIIDLSRDRMKGATATQPDGSTVRVSRAKPEDLSFTVADVPAGAELKYAAAGDPLANALAGLTFEDVAPADQIDFEGKNGAMPAGYCEFRTFDGLMVAVQLAEQNGKTWARLSAYSEAAPKPEGESTPAAKSPEDVKKEADEINARTGRWAFAIPTWKLSPFNTKMSDLIKSDEPPKPPPSLEGTTPILPTLPK